MLSAEETPHSSPRDSGIDEASQPLSRAAKKCHACVTVHWWLRLRVLLAGLSLYLSLDTSRCAASCAEAQIYGVGLEMGACG